MKRNLILLGWASLVWLTAYPCLATLYTTNWSGSFANGGVVPDNNYSG
jgi:hypothetical protein